MYLSIYIESFFLGLKFKVSFFVALEDGLTGSAWGDWSLYTASPLRAEDAEDADEPPKPPPFDPATQANTWVFHQCVTRCRWRTEGSQVGSTQEITRFPSKKHDH